MNLLTHIKRDFVWPTGGIWLTIIGVIYAAFGLVLLPIRIMIRPHFFLGASIGIIVVAMSLISSGHTVSGGITALVSLPLIALFGITSVIESVTERKLRKKI
jgi:hypothetical protein